MASGLTIFRECLNVNELSRGSLLVASDYHLINAELRRSGAKLVLSDSWDSDFVSQPFMTNQIGGSLCQRTSPELSKFSNF